MSTKDCDIAVAISYDKQTVPSISVVGRRRLARSVVSAARRWGVPVETDEDLAHQLAANEGGEGEVPPELYESVARWLYEIDP